MSNKKVIMCSTVSTKGTPRQQNLISLLLRIMAIASRSYDAAEARRLAGVSKRPPPFRGAQAQAVAQCAEFIAGHGNLLPTLSTAP
jgi:hypothetical protein